MNDGIVYGGIDPGASGGLAMIHNRHAGASSMPDTEQEIWTWFKKLKENFQHSFVMIEKVGGFIAGNPAPGSAMFKFGCSYGFLRGCLTAAGIPFDEVIPRTWQKGIGITPKGNKETKTQFKNRLKQKAQQLFPGTTVTLATADALLIAEYCRRKRQGLL